jgi:hypothetical protein
MILHIRMLAILPRLKTTPPDLISTYSTGEEMDFKCLFVKGIFGYLLMAPLEVDTCN